MFFEQFVKVGVLFSYIIKDLSILKIAKVLDKALLWQHQLCHGIQQNTMFLQWWNTAKKLFPTFDNILHVYLTWIDEGISEMYNKLIPMMAFWGQTKTGQKIAAAYHREISISCLFLQSSNQVNIVKYRGKNPGIPPL